MTYGNKMRTPAWPSNSYPFLVKIAVEDNDYIQDGLDTLTLRRYIIMAAHNFKGFENALKKITA